jgi:hypothetical protein
MTVHEQLGRFWKGTHQLVKPLARSLVKGGVGDRSDRGNLWLVPGLALLLFVVIWTAKL